MRYTLFRDTTTGDIHAVLIDAAGIVHRMSSSLHPSEYGAALEGDFSADPLLLFLLATPYRVHFTECAA